MPRESASASVTDAENVTVKIQMLHFGLCVSGVCHIHIKTPRETVATEQLQFMTD